MLLSLSKSLFEILSHNYKQNLINNLSSIFESFSIEVLNNATLVKDAEIIQY